MKTKQRNRKYFAMKWADKIMSRKEPELRNLLHDFILDNIRYNTEIANEKMREKIKQLQ